MRDPKTAQVAPSYCPLLAALERSKIIANGCWRIRVLQEYIPFALLSVTPVVVASPSSSGLFVLVGSLQKLGRPV